MSRQLLSRADQLFNGRVTYSPYQGDLPGYETAILARFKPVGSITLTFSAGLAAGASSGTLAGNWTGPTGIFPVTFSDGETLNALLTNGATTAPFYSASNPATGGAYGAGALVNAVTATATVGNQPPQAVVANGVCLSQSIATGTPATINGSLATAGVATFDVPRNVVAAWTTAAVMTVTGTDAYGQPQTESSASGTTMAGKKAFKTITAVNVSVSVTAATVGTGKVFGLPFKALSGDIALATFADAADAGTFVAADQTAVATSTTGDVRGTYAPAGTPAGASYLSIFFKPNDATTQVGTFGVTPA